MVAVLTQHCGDCSVIRHCLTYCLRHHSTAADDLALAALNLLALSVPAEVSAESSPQAEALSAKLGHAWLQCDAGGMPHNITVYSQLQVSALLAISTTPLLVMCTRRCTFHDTLCV